MTTIIVDGKEIDVPPEYTLARGVRGGRRGDPAFRVHQRLSIAGNCRMCLIEVVGGPPSRRRRAPWASRI